MTFYVAVNKVSGKLFSSHNSQVFFKRLRNLKEIVNRWAGSSRDDYEFYTLTEDDMRSILKKIES